MTISSISGGPPPFPPPGQQSPLQQNFQSLAQAIKSGDLSAAKQAFTTLSQNLPQGSGGNSPFQQALQNIGTALQSGDISGAQSALQGLQKGHHGGHHHQGAVGEVEGAGRGGKRAAGGNARRARIVHRHCCLGQLACGGTAGSSISSRRR